MNTINPIQFKRQTMDKYQAFALSIFLSDYPDDMSFDEIIDLMNSETWSADGIIVWEPFENNTLDQVADFIEDTVRTAKHFFGGNHG
jgi:hypothetical protein